MTLVSIFKPKSPSLRPVLLLPLYLISSSQGSLHAATLATRDRRQQLRKCSTTFVKYRLCRTTRRSGCLSDSKCSRFLRQAPDQLKSNGGFDQEIGMSQR
ncbi:hypothetical protein AVEN_17072-1 [Araneus ventricosus]|uniref:Uncharacterized protein n=1 Tax=Araneus ventricosus TaxID=182803 RepID=A0A4Y2SXE7_ARAVE|nr:hypothetical protein AVEN_17072-1 [Araneus ventricosus]